jgi:hypothetical protein
MNKGGRMYNDFEFQRGSLPPYTIFTMALFQTFIPSTHVLLDNHQLFLRDVFSCRCMNLCHQFERKFKKTSFYCCRLKCITRIFPLSIQLYLYLPHGICVFAPLQFCTLLILELKEEQIGECRIYENAPIT